MNILIIDTDYKLSSGSFKSTSNRNNYIYSGTILLFVIFLAIDHFNARFLKALIAYNCYEINVIMGVFC